MTEFEFTLILSGDWKPRLDALFEAGCDDATFGEVDGVPHGHFDRGAERFADALSSAIAAVESTGLAVERVEPDDLVTTAEIAARLGRSQQSVHQLISGTRGAGDFPAPALRASAPGVKGRARLWHWPDILAWNHADEETVAVAATTAALNAALELRRRDRYLGEPERELVAAVTARPPSVEK